MRVYGRVTDVLTRQKTWVEVGTDSAGFDDAVYVTALAQCLLLQLGESPFFGNWGIPAIQSVQAQIAPDYYVALMQQRFAVHFASLLISREHVPQSKLGRPTPTYSVKILTHRGSRIEFNIPT